MSSKKLPIILTIVIALGISAFLFNSQDDDVLGIDVDFGFDAQLISSDYSIVEGGSKRYKDPLERFSFRYPSEFSLGQFGDEEVGETILLQRPEEEAGFQIFVTLFDEPGRTLTVERIQNEIPNLKIIEPHPVDFAGEVLGLSFISEGESFGRSREVWIAKNGFLYQMSTYEREQSLLAEVLSSWDFK
jgi:hypothetical protein